MITYFLTVKPPPEIEDEWAEWMRSVHIPEVMQTGSFTGWSFLKCISQKDEPEYIIQYHCPDEKTMDFYFANFAPALRKDFGEKFPQVNSIERKLFTTISKDPV